MINTCLYGCDIPKTYEVIAYWKKKAATLIRSSKLNGDVKNMHKFCAAIKISTTTYRVIVDGGEGAIPNVETALRIVANIERLQSGEIEIPKTYVPEEPDFKTLCMDSKHAGVRNE
jgi:hypothetical protein